MKRVVQLLVVAACLLTTVPAHAWSDQPLDRLPRMPGDEASWHFHGPIVFARTLDGDADLWSVGADGSRPASPHVEPTERHGAGVVAEGLHDRVRSIDTERSR